jgi:hypothetical protein
MVIHILDTNDVPVEGIMVQVNCGKQVLFDPIAAEWNDGRICSECKKQHNESKGKKRSFAIGD